MQYLFFNDSECKLCNEFVLHVAHHHSKKDIKNNVKDVNSSKNQSSGMLYSTFIWKD